MKFTRLSFFFTRSASVIVLGGFLFAIFASARAQQSSPYFPGTGKKAVVQNIEEIKNPSVILMLALAPGFEDRAAIAYYRIARGATVAVAYVTNGEDLPSDFSGEMFYQLAARRKEEAYQALSFLGAQSFFLNIPVDEFSAGGGSFHPLQHLGAVLDSKLDTLMALVKPDMVVLNSDALSPTGKSARLAYLERSVIDYCRRTVVHRSEWNIKRVFVQTNDEVKIVKIPVEQKNSLWRKNYISIAKEAEAWYKSLRFQISLWDNKKHYYHQLYPMTALPPPTLDAGLPQFGAQMKKLYSSISRTFSIENEKSAQSGLEILEKTIRDVDASIGLYEHTLSASDLRILTTWKMGLENLRCALLGVDIPYSVGDSVVTQLQLFFFHVERLSPWMKKGKTQIVFPGTIQKEWIVNESENSFYALQDTQEFRVITPKHIPFTSTETPQGFSSLQNRTFFTFIVVHQDKNAIRNFMYRRQIPLIIAPVRSVEVLTPQVVLYRDSSVFVRLRSNVRDRSGGEIYISDSLVSSLKVKVELPGKNFVVTKTLPLQWKDTLNTSSHKVTLWASGNLSVGSFVCRYLDVKSNTAAKVALYSIINNSPVQIALSRLGLSPTRLDAAQFTENNLSKFTAIVIDQFSAQNLLSSPERVSELLQWISKGGKLVMLPQYGSEMGNRLLNSTISFSYLPIIGGSEAIKIDSTESVFEAPNMISENNFNTALFPLSFGGVRGVFDKDMNVLMKSAVSNAPLLVKRVMGSGTVYYCSLNLFPRFLSVDEVSYRLLANLVAQ